MSSPTLFMTGATGLIGLRVLTDLLCDDPDRRAYVLVRDVGRWHDVARAAGFSRHDVVPVRGDVTRPGLALESSERDRLARDVSLVLHCAADTIFSNSLDVARRTNTAGTRHLLDVASGWASLDRFVHVSTAFVAGRRVGTIPEAWFDDDAGFVNAYEQSKYEAEALVRASEVPWVVVRSSTVACDSHDGHVTQFNAVHRSLRLYYSGLAPMLPATESSPVDLVTTEHVADVLTAVSRAPDVEGRTFHACAGDGAITLGEMLDTARSVWSQDERWLRRSIEPPAMTDLETYRMFERTVDGAADAKLQAITRSLAHFVPQLSLAKTFAVARAESLLGRATPPVSSFWEETVRHLIDTRWAAARRAAA